MVDDTTKHTEEEYEFVDPESKDVFSQQTTSATKSGIAAGILENKTLRRNVLIVLGVLLVLLLGYRLIAPFFAGEEQDFVVPSSSSEIVEVEQAMPPVTHEISGAADVRRDLAAVSLQMDRQNQMISDLTNNLSEMNAAITALNAHVRDVDSVIERLADELARQKQTIEQLKQVEMTRGDNYYIQAIIPGRAWLQAEDGSTLTVRQGTQVPGYGEVQYIDPLQGQVILNTGRVITSNPEDS